jgi:hypothetical protein
MNPGAPALGNLSDVLSQGGAQTEDIEFGRPEFDGQFLQAGHRLAKQLPRPLHPLERFPGLPGAEILFDRVKVG